MLKGNPSFKSIPDALEAIGEAPREVHIQVTNLYVYDHKDNLLLTVPLPEGNFDPQGLCFHLQGQVYEGLKEQD